MKIYMLFTSIILLLSCSSSDRAQDGKQNSPIIIKEGSKNLYTNINVNVISIDSIMVDVVFINKSNNEYILYKPLLPSEMLNEEVFHISILDAKKVYPNVPFRRKKQDDNSGNNTDNHSYIINIKDEDFMELKANSTYSMTVNIAKLYDFSPLLKKGKNDFAIIYDALMPYVVNHKQFFEKDTIDNEIKPVYLNISTPNAGSDKYIDERVRFSIVKP